MALLFYSIVFGPLLYSMYYSPLFLILSVTLHCTFIAYLSLRFYNCAEQQTVRESKRCSTKCQLDARFLTATAEMMEIIPASAYVSQAPVPLLPYACCYGTTPTAFHSKPTKDVRRTRDHFYSLL